MKNVVLSHLCVVELFDFKNFDSNSGVFNGGDTAFDQENFSVNSAKANNTTEGHNEVVKFPTDNMLEVVEIK